MVGMTVWAVAFGVAFTAALLLGGRPKAQTAAILLSVFLLGCAMAALAERRQSVSLPQGETAFEAIVADEPVERGRTLRFLFDGSYDEFKAALFKLGETPLPRWVREKVEPEDAERYQTIFARHEGAVAAPTAGMHFSKHLMKRMEIKGVDSAFITLHVGLGNFRTVDVEDLSKHKMDSEQFFVTEEAAEAVNNAKRSGHKVVSIGTTVMRTLETAVSTNGMIKPMEGWTNKFIFYPYDFTVADAMVSNFHLPYSTQLMMVAAFGGYDTVMNAYKVAKQEGYRFGTYGDAMLIL